MVERTRFIIVEIIVSLNLFFLLLSNCNLLSYYFSDITQISRSLSVWILLVISCTPHVIWLRGMAALGKNTGLSKQYKQWTGLVHPLR